MGGATPSVFRWWIEVWHVFFVKLRCVHSCNNKKVVWDHYASQIQHILYYLHTGPEELVIATVLKGTYLLQIKVFAHYVYQYRKETFNIVGCSSSRVL